MRRTIAADRIDFYWLIGLQSFGVYHRVQRLRYRRGADRVVRRESSEGAICCHLAFPADTVRRHYVRHSDELVRFDASPPRRPARLAQGDESDHRARWAVLGLRERRIPSEPASLEGQLEMMKNGISDNWPDRALDGIAPEGYYRATLQGKGWTCVRLPARQPPAARRVDGGNRRAGSGYRVARGCCCGRH